MLDTNSSRPSQIPPQPSAQSFEITVTITRREAQLLELIRNTGDFAKIILQKRASVVTRVEVSESLMIGDQGVVAQTLKDVT
jgi:hypothetical protein